MVKYTWQILDNWTFFNVELDILTSRVGFLFALVFVISFLAFLNLVLSSANVLEGLFWAEVLLVSSIFGLVLSAAALKLPVGFVYGFFLLNATAVEAAIGMVLVLKVVHSGLSVQYSQLNSVY